MRIKIAMDTTAAAEKLTKLASTVDEEVYLEDGNGLKVRAKSILGSLHALEFEELWLVSEGDHFSLFQEFALGAPLEAPPAY